VSRTDKRTDGRSCYIYINAESCFEISCMFVTGGAYAPYASCLSTPLLRQSSFLFYTAACSPALTAVYKCVAVTVCAHDQLSAHISSRITNIVQCAVSYIALSAVNAPQSDNDMARLINMFHLRCNTDTQQPHHPNNDVYIHLNCIGLPSEPTAHNRSPPSINFAVLPV